MEIQQKFGQTVKSMRMERNLSQEQMAFKACIDTHYLSNIETGQRNVSLDIIERIANFFGVSISELFVRVERCDVRSSVVREPKEKPSQRGFYNYIIGKGLTHATANKYASNVPNCMDVQSILRKHTGSSNMYAMTDIATIKRMVKIVERAQFNITGNNMYSCGLKKYAEYIESLG